MDIFDEDLREVLGDLYVEDDAPVAMPMMAAEQKPIAEPLPHKDDAPVDANYAPVFNTKRSTAKKLGDMTKWLGVCGGISMLMWWFWQNGMMDMEAAFPCILASGMIGTGGAVWSVK